MRSCTALVGCTLLASCATLRTTEYKLLPTYCAPAQTILDEHLFERSREVDPERDARLLRHYSNDDLLLARAAGVLDQLRALEESSSTEEERRALLLETNTRLLFFATTVDSMAAELDCEAERASQMAAFLEGSLFRRNTVLTVSSIVAGALTSIITSVSEDDAVIATAGSAGGVASAALGAATLMPGPDVVYEHPRNPLADVWFLRTTPEAFPPALWYVLRQTTLSNDREHSIAENVRARWIAFGDVALNDQWSPYFGTGARYSPDQLQVRANMLNQLQATVRLINQNLRSLLFRIASNTGTSARGQTESRIDR